MNPAQQHSALCNCQNCWRIRLSTSPPRREVVAAPPTYDQSIGAGASAGPPPDSVIPHGGYLPPQTVRSYNFIRYLVQLIYHDEQQARRCFELVNRSEGVEEECFPGHDNLMYRVTLEGYTFRQHTLDVEMAVYTQDKEPIRRPSAIEKIKRLFQQKFPGRDMQIVEIFWDNQ